MHDDVSRLTLDDRKEQVIQVPITLIHSISLDPPPNQGALKTDLTDAKHGACRQMLVDLFRQTPATEDDDNNSDLEFTCKDSRTTSYHNGADQHEADQQPMVRHGSMWSPKQFGNRPGCLGNAGLDIRRKFNVATAHEAWHGYTADHYYLPSCTTGGTSETSPITPVDERRRMFPLSQFDLDNNVSARAAGDRKILALLENHFTCDIPPPSIVHTF